MSIIRRVKSFSIKKSSSSDELKSEVPFRQTPRPRRKNLVKEKSVSMEYVPLHLELEKSDLFKRQKSKQQEENVKPIKDPPQPRRPLLKKRKSVSFDDVRLSKFNEELREEVSLRRQPSGRFFPRLRSRYNTLDVLKDLIKDCENEPRTPVDNIRKPRQFPSPEEVEEVPIRRNRSVRTERPKTYASTLTKKKEEPLEFKGVTRLEVGCEICVKVRQKQRLRLLDGYLALIDDRGTVQGIRDNVTLQKGVKIISKKELEILDSKHTPFRLHFDSSKEAKLFLDIEKSYHSSPSSALKNIGAWSQLRKLLKKRSSRDILESKGIIKNEPIFGNTLEELCSPENPVPEVVTKLVTLIEDPRNIVSVGIYRASANLAVLQNIRCEINLGKWDILEQYRLEADVLTGTLKLFFRELKQPLIREATQQELHKALIGSTTSTKEDINQIVNRLPLPNKLTFLFIIRHLVKVCKYDEQNKMDFKNMAICWGPALFPLTDNCTDMVVRTAEFQRITEDLLRYYSQGIEDTPPPPVDIPPPTDFTHDVIRRLTEIIEANIEVEGIYRKSGSTSKIDKIMKSLDKKSLTELESVKNDIHDLCCVLKKYVASIRAMIVPEEFFHRYLEICDNVADSFLRDEVRRMVDELPRKDIIFLIFDHLCEVVQHQQKNKMSLSVISDIWMTTLMAGSNVQTYRKNMPKYTKLFLIFMNLNDRKGSNRETTKGRYLSKYDNVPDDIHIEEETKL